MDNFLYAFVFFIVALGLLIAVHEFGHYWVAKKLGVKVLRFSIGFGHPLWQRTAGPDRTEYVIAAIPLGGYVKMLDERDPDCEVTPAEQHRAFNRQPLSTRIAVVAAGPLFNFVFAIIAYWMLFMMGVPGVKPLIGDVQPGSVFAQAGVKTGDLIQSINDEPMATLENVRLTLMEGVLSDEVLQLTVQGEDLQSRQLALDLRSLDASAIDEDFMQRLGFTPLRPQIPAVIAELQPDGAAQVGGMQAGDEVTAVDGQPVADWEAWAAYVRSHAGRPISVTVLRDGMQHQLTLTPAAVETPEGAVGRVGAMPLIPEGLFDEFRAVQSYSLLAAIPAALNKTWDMSVMTLTMLWKMLVGEASIENISGPLTIASYAGQTAQVGLVAFISFLAIVSVSLGVLNLLPVPVLDGGHLMYYVVEFVKGSPVSEQAQLVGQKIGIIMLGGLMFLALYNDINRLFS